MESFKEFLLAEDDKIDNNTIVCSRKDANRFEVTKCGKNCTFLTPGQTLTVDNCKELSGKGCLLYTSPSPRDQRGSRMPSSA